jgi:hypothetical protein
MNALFKFIVPREIVNERLPSLTSGHYPSSGVKKAFSAKVTGICLDECTLEVTRRAARGSEDPGLGGSSAVHQISRRKTSGPSGHGASADLSTGGLSI